MRQDFEAINRTFNGANLVSIYVDTHVNDALTDPVQMRPLEQLEEWLHQQPEVGRWCPTSTTSSCSTRR